MSADWHSTLSHTIPHLDTAVMIQQESEAGRRQAQHSRGLTRIEQVDHVQTKITLRGGGMASP